MFEFCSDPSALTSGPWLACYLTTPKHMNLYWAVPTVFMLLAVTAPLSLALGLAAAMSRRASFAPVRWLGLGYTSIVRGIPDLLFFLSIPLALDIGLEMARHGMFCSNWGQDIWQGNDFRVCPQAKLPLGPSPQWVHESYNFGLAVVSYALVFGAFTANVMHGALNAVPQTQLETARAYGMRPIQIFRRVHLPLMWVYALPGLSNLWMILIKATPLLFILGIEDVVYWARELGASKTARFSAYPHPNWSAYYFFALLIFYLLLTWFSQIGLGRLTKRLSKGQATVAGLGVGL